MKKVIKLLSKYYETNISKEMKKKQDMIKKLCKEYDLTFESKNDYSCFKNEVLYESLCNKMKFEETFQNAYGQMADFFDSLDYQTKKRLMNTEVDKVKKEMKKFQFMNKEIYIPVFDDKMNTIYSDEMALFTLKQYHSLIKNFKEHVKQNLYGEYPYQSGFSSAVYVCSYETGFVLKYENNLYFIENDILVQKLSFSDKIKECDNGTISILVQLYRCGKTEEFIKFLMNYEFVEGKIYSKLEKYLNKMK